MQVQHLTIRLATTEDAPALHRLADLDSAPGLKGRVLIAELGDEPLAAVSLETGTANANPFRRSAWAVQMLRLRRYELLRQGGDMAPAPSLLRRLASAPAGAGRMAPGAAG